MALDPNAAPAGAPQADPGADPSQGGDSDEGQGSYVIEIAVGGDGSLSVSVESGAQESAEGAPGAGEDDASAQPAANIKEALTLALAAYKNNGKLPDMKGQNDQFDEGFSSGPGGQ